MGKPVSKSRIDRAAAPPGALSNALRGSDISRLSAKSQSTISDILTGGRSTLASIAYDKPARTHATLAPPAKIDDAKPAEQDPRRRDVPVTSVGDIGELVRQARADLGLNQQRFADLAGVGRRFVSELEAGKASLETERVLRCCLAAGIDVLARPRRR